jgi:hypothetical protein
LEALADALTAAAWAKPPSEGEDAAAAKATVAAAGWPRATLLALACEANAALPETLLLAALPALAAASTDGAAAAKRLWAVHQQQQHEVTGGMHFVYFLRRAMAPF